MFFGHMYHNALDEQADEDNQNVLVFRKHSPKGQSLNLCTTLGGPYYTNQPIGGLWKLIQIILNVQKQGCSSTLACAY